MDLERTAIARLQEASRLSLEFYHQPLLITTSGGKDSSVCMALAERAGIPYEVLHHHTTVDAPETVCFIRDTFKHMEARGVKCSIDYPVYKGAPVSMWTLIPQKLIPPTRLVRYCSDILKEHGGRGRFITTGVRWAESAKRKNNRGIFETVPSNRKKKVILTDDADDKRVLFTAARPLGRRPSAFVIPSSTGRIRTSGPTSGPRRYRSIRSTPAVFTAWAASAVLWLRPAAGKSSPATPSTRPCICGPSTG